MKTNKLLIATALTCSLSTITFSQAFAAAAALPEEMADLRLDAKLTPEDYQNKFQTCCIFGLQGSGKSTTASALSSQLSSLGIRNIHVNPENSKESWQSDIERFYREGTGGIVILDIAGLNHYVLDKVAGPFAYRGKSFRPIYISFGYDDDEANDAERMRRILSRSDHATLGKGSSEREIKQAFSSARAAYLKQGKDKKSVKAFFDEISATTGNFREIPFNKSVEENQAVICDMLAAEAKKAALASQQPENVAKKHVYSYRKNEGALLSYTALKLDEEATGRIREFAVQSGVSHAANANPSVWRTVDFFNRRDWTPEKEETFISGITAFEALGTNQEITVTGFIHGEKGSAAIVTDNITGKKGYITLSYSDKSSDVSQMCKDIAEGAVLPDVHVIDLQESIILQSTYEPVFVEGNARAPKGGQRGKAKA